MNNLVEQMNYYLSLRRNLRIVCLFATAICFGIALASWAWFGAALALALSEIFRD